jgi:hypothetical protein
MRFLSASIISIVRNRLYGIPPAGKYQLSGTDPSEVFDFGVKPCYIGDADTRDSPGELA